MQMLLANWEWVLLALYVVEKAVKLSPSKKDDVIFDMVVKPIFDISFTTTTAVVSIIILSS